jgi:hypothetical protein
MNDSLQAAPNEKTRPKQPTKIVGASLLAMDSRAPRLASKHALSFTTIASKLAPTRKTRPHQPNADQLSKLSSKTYPVAAGEACVRLRSSRKS